MDPNLGATSVDKYKSLFPYAPPLYSSFFQTKLRKRHAVQTKDLLNISYILNFGDTVCHINPILGTKIILMLWNGRKASYHKPNRENKKGTIARTNTTTKIEKYGNKNGVLIKEKERIKGGAFANFISFYRDSTKIILQHQYPPQGAHLALWSYHLLIATHC